MELTFKLGPSTCERLRPFQLINTMSHAPSVHAHGHKCMCTYMHITCTDTSINNEQVKMHMARTDMT